MDDVVEFPSEYSGDEIENGASEEKLIGEDEPTREDLFEVQVRNVLENAGPDSDGIFIVRDEEGQIIVVSNAKGKGSKRLDTLISLLEMGKHTLIKEVYG